MISLKIFSKARSDHVNLALGCSPYTNQILGQRNVPSPSLGLIMMVLGVWAMQFRMFFYVW